jgi:hypothetical protein
MKTTVTPYSTTHDFLRSLTDTISIDELCRAIFSMLKDETFISTRETLHYLERNKIPFVFLKIDFRKTFDTISWDVPTRGAPDKRIPITLDIMDLQHSNLLDLLP